MLIGLINRNGQLHIGVVPQGHPSSQIKFKLYWMSEGETSLNLNPILDFTTKIISEHEAYSINTRENIISNKTNYTTKYVLSYIVNGKENFSWYTRTEGNNSAIVDSNVNVALYNFLKIPGVENAKNTKGGWNKNLQKWFVHKDPRGLSTIGYGHLITNVGNDTVNAYKNGITDVFALNLLKSDVDDHVGYAKDIMGDCWGNLDFWAKVLYAELVYNIGKASARDKYPNLKASLLQKNYGSMENLNDPPAPKNSKTGVTFREFKRNYKDPDSGQLKPCVERHKHIIRHILIKLVAFKKIESSTQQSKINEFCYIDDFNGETDNGYANIDSSSSEYTVSSNEIAEILNEKTCEYSLQLSGDFDEGQSEFFTMRFSVKEYENECPCPSSMLEQVFMQNVTTCKNESYGYLELVFKHDIIYELIENPFKSNKFNYIIKKIK